MGKAGGAGLRDGAAGAEHERAAVRRREEPHHAEVLDPVEARPAEHRPEVRVRARPDVVDVPPTKKLIISAVSAQSNW